METDINSNISFTNEKSLKGNRLSNIDCLKLIAMFLIIIFIYFKI